MEEPDLRVEAYSLHRTGTVVGQNGVEKGEERVDAVARGAARALGEGKLRRWYPSERRP